MRIKCVFFFSDEKWEKIALDIIRCLKATMNNRYGLKQMYETKDSVMILARCIDPDMPTVMLESVKLVAALCIANKEGYDLVLEGITMCAETRGREDQRFVPIVKGLGAMDNMPLQIVCLQLINALVSQPEELEFRIHLRNEFNRAGLGELLETLRCRRVRSESESSQVEKNLATQLQVFDEHKSEDYDDFCARFDAERVALEDLDECYELVKNMVLDTPAELPFLSVLQHLVFIRDDIAVRTAYFRLLEEIVSQVVLHKTGFDPNFKHFVIDKDTLMEALSGQFHSEITVKALNLPPHGSFPYFLGRSEAPYNQAL